jgi:hypothetical protein
MMNGILNELYFYLADNWLGLTAAIYVILEILYLLRRFTLIEEPNSSDT